MKTPTSPSVATNAPDAPRPKRRQLVVGAGVAAGAALATAALRQHVETPATVAKAGAQVSEADGYRVTDHIRRYYETTRT